MKCHCSLITSEDGIWLQTKHARAGFFFFFNSSLLGRKVGDLRAGTASQGFFALHIYIYKGRGSSPLE